jgi:tRNA (cytidine/uridine-2'-O-)-methyltransferase
VIHVALFEPEIAGNAGASARTCLATGSSLHLIRPLGFRLTDEAVRRAGMDYWQEAEVTVHSSFALFQEVFSGQFASERVFALSTKATRLYSEVGYTEGDVLLFGPESRGLPEEVRALCRPVRIPMRPEVRSLNLAVSVGVALYECRRQLGAWD